MAPSNLGPSSRAASPARCSAGCCAGNMIEEIPAQGSLPVWRSDEDSGALALSITEHGRAAIGDDQGGEAGPGVAPTKPTAPTAPHPRQHSTHVVFVTRLLHL